MEKYIAEIKTIIWTNCSSCPLSLLMLTFIGINVKPQQALELICS